MFTRGGVYRVVKEAMGGTLAKISVSALLFDYVLTGQSARFPPASTWRAWSRTLAGTRDIRLPPFPRTASRRCFAIFVVVYFWWQNIKGIHESSGKALQIMIVTTVMVVILIAWCMFTILRHPTPLPPSPDPRRHPDQQGSLGWLNGTFFSHLTWILMFVGFGHSVLAMSGEETLAQVNRKSNTQSSRTWKKPGL